MNVFEVSDIYVYITHMDESDSRWVYRVAKTHRKPQIAGHFSQKRH